MSDCNKSAREELRWFLLDKIKALAFVRANVEFSLGSLCNFMKHSRGFKNFANLIHADCGILNFNNVVKEHLFKCLTRFKCLLTTLNINIESR